MKQPQDNKTLDLLDQAKRGRGRPRLEHALTPAERAKRYRDNKRLERQVTDTRMRIDIPLIAAEVTENSAVTENENDALFWREMYEAEAARGQELEARIAAGRKGGWSYAEITEITEKRVSEFMAAAAVDNVPTSAAQKRDWAFGAVLGWSRLTQGFQADGDQDRLFALAENQ